MPRGPSPGVGTTASQRERKLSQSVSLILPVRDLQNGLRDRVQTILEILAELSNTFDLLIVDYGSRDETREVAMDLVREYPQVDFMDWGERGGGSELFSAIEAGIRRTRGEIIFIHDPMLPLGLSALQGLWQMRDDDDLVMAQSRATGVPLRSLLATSGGRQAPMSSRSSIQMIRRCAIRELPARQQPASSFTVDRVTRTDLLDEPADALRLPKLLTRLRRLTTY